jgi:hypothetical protein
MYPKNWDLENAVADTYIRLQGVILRMTSICMHSYNNNWICLIELIWRTRGGREELRQVLKMRE